MVATCSSILTSLLILLVFLFAHSCHVVATFVKAVEDDGGTEEKAAPACEEIFSPAVFVNTRRGKGNGTKRKISDASIPARAPPVRPSAQLHTETHATNILFIYGSGCIGFCSLVFLATPTKHVNPCFSVKVDDEVAESCELRETKKRKVSSTNDSEDTQTGTAVSGGGNKGDMWLLCLFLL